MTDKMHRDLVHTDDLYLCALAHFQGYRIWRVETSDYTKSIFHLLVPSEDWEFLKQEYAAEDSTLMNIKKYVESIGVVHSLIRRAKKSGNIFTEKF